jgi:4,5:9,10-diseco-3-hydroxy-5,9,17-trioxoandrosta-1(10),2-diene-4-oate hydrolase
MIIDSQSFLATGQMVDLPCGLRTHFIEIPATSAAGKTVVFVHGSGPGASGWSNFQANLQPFADAGHRVVVFDLPGYGETDKPTDAIYSLDYFVDHLRDLLDHLEIDQAILVGNSLGGAISLGLTLAHPGRVEKLILMATGGIEEREAYFAMSGIQAMVAYPMGSPAFTRQVLGSLLQRLVYDNRLVTEQLISQRWHILQQQNPQVLATMQIPNLTDRLKEISCPVLAFWGREDEFCPISGALTLQTECQHIKVITLSQCGHWVMVEHPEMFNREALEFIEGNQHGAH